MLKWETLKDEGRVKLIEPDPFEPVILCFERGGRPFSEHGYLHISHCGSFVYGYGHWPGKFADVEPVPLDQYDLDAIDREINALINRRSST